MHDTQCSNRGSEADPNEPVGDAARVMADLDVGAMPVGENDWLIGMVTDRDIAVRAVAEGKGSDCRVRDVMTPEIHCCFDDEDIEEVLEIMGEIQVRRLPVLNRKNVWLASSRSVILPWRYRTNPLSTRSTRYRSPAASVCEPGSGHSPQNSRGGVMVA
jgi:CBS domain-containing protein